MVKKVTKKQSKQSIAYLENYNKLVGQLTTLSKIKVRQFMGTREDDDPRVNYLAGLESFKNLANAQISGIGNILTMLLGPKTTEFLKVMEDELTDQLKSMEEDVGVAGWNDDGTPKLDLQVYREKTKGWPK